MTYNYKCENCNEVIEIVVQTSDIIDKYGRVDQDKLSMRMYEPRQCQCGGNLKKILTIPQEAMYFNAGIGKGKISQRFQ
jgi:predicted nucleic acid-binding Zn ribbon protein